MEKDKHITKVVFRKFKDGGDIIAIFPELPGTNDPATCMSYQHTGQHGSCDSSLAQSTIPPTCEEIAPLKRELEGIGYNLKVMRKVTYKNYLERKAAIKESRK